MARKKLESVKPCSAIYCNGEDVLLIDKDVWLFRKDGTPVTKIKEVHYTFRMLFLPGRKAVLDYSRKHRYVCISTEDGSVLWEIQKKCRQEDLIHGEFVLSADGAFLYDFGYTKTNRFHVDCISLADQAYSQNFIKESLRTTPAAYCDKYNNLCLLQEHTIVGNDEKYTGPYPRQYMHQLGILACPYKDGDLRPYWKSLWQEDHYWHVIACNDRYVLFADLSVWDFEQKQKFYLVPEEIAQTLPRCGVGWAYNSQRKLLTVCHLIGTRTLVVDVTRRKVVGDYSVSKEDQPGLVGCVIDDAFWIGTAKGVIRLPFPNV